MANRYWVGGTGTWDATSTANWSTASGGSSGASVPTSADSVFFDQAGTYTVTLSGALNCLDFTVSAGTVTFSGTPTTLYVYGSINFIAGTVFSATFGATGFLLRGIGKTITTNGTAFTNANIYLNAVGSTPSYTLIDALTARGFFLNNADINLNGLTVTVTGTSTSFFYATSTLNFGSNGGIIFSSTGSLSMASTNACTFSGTGTIRFNATSNLGGQSSTFTGVTLIKGGTGTLTISGSNTFDAIQNATQPVTFNFTSGTTTTVTNFNVSGISGSLVTLKASSAGSQFTISKSSGTVSSNYLSVKDSAATGGASWYAGANSTDAGNNTGWSFSAAPAAENPGAFFGLLLIN